jgi:LAO/AO transport system kinase
VLLGKAITLIESTKSEHKAIAQEVIQQCLPHSGQSVRVGVTGSPGVGKSTFIEALGTYLADRSHRIAVLAIDPSSRLSRGSILGDKTRMERLSNHERAFVRPSPAGDSLGGVARKTRESIILCEAAGYDVVLVETVGVGQSETAAHSMVDVFLLLLLPGAGDELQGIKRGIVEMADLLAVNKADGDRLDLARLARREYYNALHLFPPKDNDWTPQVLTCSALEGTGIAEVWLTIGQFCEHTRPNGHFEWKRRQQARFWMMETIRAGLEILFFENPALRQHLSAMEAAVQAGEISPFQAAEEMLGQFRALK